MNYKFIPYDSVYPGLFEKEKVFLKKILSNKIIVEHFGSTAVPGLGGKGVIDIYLLVEKELMKIASKILCDHGYEYKKNTGDENRWFHQINKKHGDKSYHYHIHLSFFGNKNFEDCIDFRDYLRTNPEAVKKYSQIKQKASKNIESIIDKKELKKVYMNTKNSVIQEIMRKIKKI